MTDHEDHEDLEGLAAGYSLHALEPADEQRLAAHLLTCHSCARLAADTAAIGAAFADLIPSEAADAPPPSLRARILEAAAAEPREFSPSFAAAPVTTQASRIRAVPVPRPNGAVLPAVGRSRFGRMQVRSRLAVAALAAVVGVGVAVPVTLAVSGGGTSKPNSALAEALTEPQAREVTLRGAGKAAGAGVAKAVVSPSGVYLVASGLPVNDRSHTVYVLWASDSHGESRAVATFDVRSGSPVQLISHKAPFTSADIRQLAVSHEPGRKAPLKPSEVVLSGTA